MPIDPGRLVLGAGIAAAIAVLARGRRSLSRGGALAATVVGVVVVAAGGWWWGLLLVAFFASSSVLSKAARRTDGAEVAARGAERDAVQVVANSGIATLLALLASYVPNAAAPLYAGFAGAVAAATADTWATEIGARSRAAPRSIIDRRPVSAGTSGGVTRLGSSASVAGATFLAALAGVGAALGAAPAAVGPAIVGLAVAVAGVAGSLLDSVLGATLQAAYHCPTCRQPTERPRHECGTAAELVRGHRLIDNDIVNLAATVGGALVGLGGALLA